MDQAGSAHLTALLQDTVAQARRALGVERVSALVGEQDDPSGLAAVASDGEDWSRDGARIEQLAGEVIASGAPLALAWGAAAPLRWCGAARGVLVATTADPSRVDVGRLEALASLAGAAIEQATERDRLGGTLRAGVEALASLIDLRDGYTGRHSDQVVGMGRHVGERLGLKGRDLAELAIAARLHDIGKIGVPDSILLKPGPLTEAEQRIIRCHPAWGAETLERLPGLERVAETVRHHHERWDGQGYPTGLAGEAIPLASRIIGVCDAFGAMTSTRPYRRALEVHEAVRLLAAGAGAQFDRDTVRALCEALDTGLITIAAEEAPQAAPGPRPAATANGAESAPPQSRRLAKAFERLEALPALSESRQRLLGLLGDERPSTQDIIVTVESDAALTIAVLRAANRLPGPRQGKIAGIPEALRALSPSGLERLVSRVATFEFFQRLPGWEAPEQFRLHAVATRHAAALITRRVDLEDPDPILVAALLHDVGKLVLSDAYPDYPAEIHGNARTPEERVWAEQRALGIDHALVGAVLIRRWRLPARVATAVERHHLASEPDDAAVVRLADLLAHYARGNPINPRELERAGRALGLEPTSVRSLMFELPLTGSPAPRASEPSPLSRQETRALRELAKGKVYKEIAADLGLSSSTVRSHLSHTYDKLGVADRAQAVLIATENGWI